ncbi:MAG: diaminopimelate epimerase [Candidatus Stygibacter frigidus]|nr:diaminopimelate epimerase [Candidatus Stygibacter frigidus]
MKLDFIKMTAQGNDYIYIDRRKTALNDINIKELVLRLSDRHFGIGSDGVVFMHASSETDLRMEMYNADGSRGKMCGSALRSLIYLLSMEKQQQEYTVATDSGFRKGWIIGDKGLVKVEMGKVMQYDQIEDEDDYIYLVNVGNLHAVKIFDDMSDLDLLSEIKRQETFLEEIALNHEFVEISDSESINMQIYELGSGFTLACGTGAVAGAYTSRQEGMVRGDEIKVTMPGGEVIVKIDSEEIYLTGIVKEVFRGIIEI